MSDHPRSLAGSSRQHLQQELLESEQLFRCVFDTAQDGILVLDADSLTPLLANPALGRMLGHALPDLLALTLEQLHPVEHAPAALETYACMARGELHKARLPLQRRDGSGFNAEISASRLELQGRHYLVATVRDLSTSERAEQAEELARLDGLTGLGNHRAFQELLAQELARAQRHGTPVSLLLLDIDHFKRINDTLGHQAGDAVLRQLGSLLLDSARNIDHVCRYGGEEFTLVLPMTNTGEALQVAERLRREVEGFEFACGGANYQRLTVSAGVASYPRHAQNQTALIAAADAAMYAAKRQGRNRCIVFDATMPD